MTDLNKSYKPSSLPNKRRKLTFVWVVIRLLNECQFLTLRLIKAALDRVCRLFKLFNSQDKQFGVVLV